MLKLLKYDWRRNSLVFYVCIALLVALNALFEIGLLVWDWNQYVVFSFTIMAFVAAGITLFVRNATLFSDNLKSYSRRLLPVSPYQEIGSIFVVQLIYTIILSILLTLTLYLLSFTFDFMNLEKLNVSIESNGFLVVTVLYGIWSTVNTLLYIFFAITIALTFRVKYRVWIGTGVFIVLTMIISRIADIIFGKSSNMGIQAGPGDSAVFLLFPSQYLSKFIAGFLFEIVVAAIIAYCTALLMKKKIEL